MSVCQGKVSISRILLQICLGSLDQKRKASCLGLFSLSGEGMSSSSNCNFVITPKEKFYIELTFASEFLLLLLTS